MLDQKEGSVPRQMDSLTFFALKHKHGLMTATLGGFCHFGFSPKKPKNDASGVSADEPENSPSTNQRGSQKLVVGSKIDVTCGYHIVT